MRALLPTSYDRARFAAFEAVVIAVAVFVHGGWQYPALLAGGLGLAGLAGVLRSTGVVRTRPIAFFGEFAPWWLQLPIGLAALSALGAATRALGADGSDAWMASAFGAFILTSPPVDRWWRRRAIDGRATRRTAGMSQSG